MALMGSESSKWPMNGVTVFLARRRQTPGHKNGVANVRPCGGIGPPYAVDRVLSRIPSIKIGLARHTLSRAGRDIVKTDQIDIVAGAMLRHLEKVNHAQET